jgi:hypothetical protein
MERSTVDSSRTFLAATGAAALLAGAALLAQTASAGAADGLVKASLNTPAATGADGKGHFAKAAFGQPASPGVAPAVAAATAESGVVVTYENNRSSVVVTGHGFGLDPAVAGGVSATTLK